MNVQEFSALLAKPRPFSYHGMPGYRALCPAHDDKEPSFAVWEAEDGWLAMRCQKGCSRDDIIAALGVDKRELKVFDATSYNARPPSVKRRQIPQHKARYDWIEGGRYKFTKLRIEPGANGRAKDFIQGTIHGTEWCDGVPRNLSDGALYRIDDLLSAYTPGARIYIHESEKAVDASFECGHLATCQPHGAGPGKFTEAHVRKLPADADYWVIADRDPRKFNERKEPMYNGEDYAAEVAKLLPTATVAQSATTGEKDDGYDHYLAGYGEDEWVLRPDLTPALMGRLVMEEREPVEHEFLWEPYLPLGKTVLLDGDGGTGKSTLALGWAASLSQGITPLESRPVAPCRTLYIGNGENDDAEIEHVYFANGGRPGGLVIEQSIASFTDEAIASVGRMISAYGIKLVLVDVMAYFMAGVVRDSYNMVEVSGFCAKFNRLAGAKRCCWVDFRHTRKGAQQGSASDAGAGSVAFRNSHRGQLLLRRHPEDDWLRVLTDEKGSMLIPQGPPVGWRKIGAQVQYTGYLDENPFTKQPGRPPSERDEAAKWLHAFLKANGSTESTEVIEAAAREDISRATLYRAKGQLRSFSPYTEAGKSFWALDPYADEDPRFAPGDDSRRK